MIYGEHLSAEEICVKCPCGVTATVDVPNKQGISQGLFCRRCAVRVRAEIDRQEKLARAIVRGRLP